MNSSLLALVSLFLCTQISWANGSSSKDEVEFINLLSSASEACKQLPEVPDYQMYWHKTFKIYSPLKKASNLLRANPESFEMRTSSVERQINECMGYLDFPIQSTLVYMGQDLQNDFGLKIILVQLNQLIQFPNKNLRSQIEYALQSYDLQDIRKAATELNILSNPMLAKYLGDQIKRANDPYKDEVNALGLVKAMLVLSETQLELATRVISVDILVEQVIDAASSLSSEDSPLRNSIPPEAQQALKLASENKPLIKEVLTKYLKSECRISEFANAPEMDMEVIAKRLEYRLQNSPECQDLLQNLKVPMNNTFDDDDGDGDGDGDGDFPIQPNMESLMQKLKIFFFIIFILSGSSFAVAEGQIRGVGLFSFGNYGHFPKDWALHSGDNSLRYVREGMHAIYVWVELDYGGATSEKIECAKQQVDQTKIALNSIEPSILNPLFKRDGPLMLWDMVVDGEPILAVNISEVSGNPKPPFYSSNGIDEFHVEFSVEDENCFLTNSEVIKTNLLMLSK